MKKRSMQSSMSSRSSIGGEAMFAPPRSPPELYRLNSSRHRDSVAPVEHHRRIHSADRALSPRTPSPLPFIDTEPGASHFRFPPPLHAPPPTREHSMLGQSQPTGSSSGGGSLAAAISAAATTTSKSYQQELDEQYFATIQPNGAASHQILNQSFRRQARNKPKLLRQAHAEFIELSPRNTRERSSITRAGGTTNVHTETSGAVVGGSRIDLRDTSASASSAGGYQHHGSFAGFTTASYGSVGYAPPYACNHQNTHTGLGCELCTELGLSQSGLSAGATSASSAAVAATMTAGQLTAAQLGFGATGASTRAKRCSFCVAGMCACCSLAATNSSAVCCEKCGQPLASVAAAPTPTVQEPCTAAEFVSGLDCRCNSAPTLAFSQTQLEALLLHSPAGIQQRKQQQQKPYHQQGQLESIHKYIDEDEDINDDGLDADDNVAEVRPNELRHAENEDDDDEDMNENRQFLLHPDSFYDHKGNAQDDLDSSDEDDDDEDNVENENQIHNPLLANSRRLLISSERQEEENKENQRTSSSAAVVCECARLLPTEAKTTVTSIGTLSTPNRTYGLSAHYPSSPSSRLITMPTTTTTECAQCKPNRTRGVRSTLVSLAHASGRALSPLGRSSRSSSKESIKSPKHEKKKRRFSRKALSLLRVHHFRKSKSEESSKEVAGGVASASSNELSAICKARSHNYALIREINERCALQTLQSSAESPTLEIHPHQSHEFKERKSSTPTNLTKNAAASLDQRLSSSQNKPSQYLFGLHVHSVDRKLKSSKCVVNPLVRLHFCSIFNGECIRSSETEPLLPVSTQPCDLLFKLRYPRAPLWEELLLINEPYRNLLRPDVILFLEVLDFVSVHNSDVSGQNKPKDWWYRVAWSFLLPYHCCRDQVGSESSFRPQKLRIQLFKPYSHSVDTNLAPSAQQLFTWWKSYKRIPYPSSLLVSLQPVDAANFRNFAKDVNFRNLNQYLYERRLQHFYRNFHSMSFAQAPTSLTAITGQPMDAADSLQQYASTAQRSHSPVQKSGVYAGTTPATSAVAHGFNSQHPPPSAIVHLQHLQSQQASNSSTEDPDLPVRGDSTTLSNRPQKCCKMPRNLWHQLSAGNNKCCYNVAFSSDGRKIACGASVFTAYMSNEKRSSIFIYSIPNGEFLQRVNGFHSAPIYYLDWSRNDRLLASASADCTCLVWQMKRAHCAPLALNHPCFVYTVKFHPSNYHQLATGAWDGAVRIWCIQESLRSTIKEPVLLQCVAATGSVAAATFHGQVLALCWLRTPTAQPPSAMQATPGTITAGQKFEYLLFSGCSRGHLMALKQDENNQSWQPYLKLKLKEINNIAINELQAHPVGSNRLILFCRDGVQRMVDYHLELIVQRYIGSLNFNHLIRGCLSSDGKLLFAGSEDSIVHVWNVDTGEQIYTYNNLPFRGSIACIQYHPFENIIAISGLNARTISVCLYKHGDIIQPSPGSSRNTEHLNQSIDSQQRTNDTLITFEANGAEREFSAIQMPPDLSEQISGSGGSGGGGGSVGIPLGSLSKNLGSVSNAENVSELQKTPKPELKKSHTIDHSNPTSSGHASKTNQKVQKAMRKLELALRLSFNDNK